MQNGFRLEATIEPNKHDVRTSKELLAYTAGDIKDKGVNWMTDTAQNADMLTRKGDAFDIKFKNGAKKIITIALKETQMRVAPWKEKQYIETFSIRWIPDGKTWNEFWRLIIFHHVTVMRHIEIKVPNGTGSYYIVMKVEADVEYKTSDGSDAT